MTVDVSPSALSGPSAGPDLRHIEAWIFDLDNTLYPASSGLFSQIDARMTKFVQNLLGIGEAEARALQKAYYREHGTTLSGLMRMHGVSPDAYLGFVHDIDLGVLAPDPRLGSVIRRLPGRRFIFTNGCRNHAARVLGRLGLDDLFDDVWDIKTVSFRPKPDLESYRFVMSQSAIAPERAAMFEDAARNLVPAHELGMTTVWLKNGSIWSKQGPEYPQPEDRHIHYETDDLPSFLQSIRV
jgi:putative hydrolase of the HAD superfamily